MIGLDGAGKTTILYHLKDGHTVKTVPTVGFNVETVDVSGIRLDVWDVGGQDKLRSLWKHYIQNAKVIVFVVDVADRDRLIVAGDELSHILEDSQLHSALLLIYGNKQDMPEAAKPEEVIEALRLESLSNTWKYQPSIAIQGEGLQEGISWIAEHMSPGGGGRKCSIQ